MEFKKKTIIWENNNEPPKNYIWIKPDGKAYEYNNDTRTWELSKLFGGSSDCNCDCVTPIYGGQDQSEVTDPREGDIFIKTNTVEQPIDVSGIWIATSKQCGTQEDEIHFYNGSSKITIPQNAISISITQGEDEIETGPFTVQICTADEVDNPDYDPDDPDSKETIWEETCETETFERELTITDNNGTSHSVPSTFSAEGISELTFTVTYPSNNHNEPFDLFRITVLVSDNDVLEYYNGQWLSRVELSELINGAQRRYETDNINTFDESKLKEGDIVVEVTRETTPRFRYVYLEHTFDITEENWFDYNSLGDFSLKIGPFGEGDYLTISATIVSDNPDYDENDEESQPSFFKHPDLVNIDDGVLETTAQYTTDENGYITFSSQSINTWVESQLNNMTEGELPHVSSLQIDCYDVNLNPYCEIVSDETTTETRKYYEVICGELSERGRNSVENEPDDPEEEEQYCPNCGEVWDGYHCDNCGYPDIEEEEPED